ncbi:response regulator [Actinacidiphila rubida]|uniref:Two component transcriptional regulator, LuxR family n=1 Tax=Actinacidiphila rubida TaxID=310780 RepID=A0A1H8KC01_9ACTN|nr:response regulator transcription factor [Actinacidiphila rubida]SEN90510.1 two component transcriptional regulator, LuxR family [Actinacidiphila rubida]
MTGTRIRVLLVDDHVILRETLRECLQLEADFEVVGDAPDGAQAVALCSRLRPDVLLLDVETPGQPVDVTVPRVLEASPRTRVIMLSMHESPDLVRELLALGIRGYLNKRVSRQHLVSVIRGCMREGDEVLISVSQFAALPGTGNQDGRISAREREVLTLVADALSNRQIAARLGITEGTVKRHLRNVFEKLGAVSRIDAVNKGVDASLIAPPQPRSLPGRPVWQR